MAIVTPEEAATYFGSWIPDVDPDQLMMLIDVVQGELEAYLDRPLEVADFTESKVVNLIEPVIYLSNTPVLAIVSATADGNLVDANEYTMRAWGLDFAGFNTLPLSDPVIWTPSTSHFTWQQTPDIMVLGAGAYPQSTWEIVYTAGLDGPNIWALKGIVLEVLRRMIAGLSEGLGSFYDQIKVEDYCVDAETEALTRHGWVRGDELAVGEDVLTCTPAGQMEWAPVEDIYRGHHDGPMFHLQNRFIDALVTPGHRFLYQDGELAEVERLVCNRPIRTMGSAVQNSTSIYSDAFVEVMGWAITEGCYQRNRHGNITTVIIYQKEGTSGVDKIRLALKRAGAAGGTHLKKGETGPIRAFTVSGEVAREIVRLAPGRVLSYDFLTSLSTDQIELLFQTMIEADGHQPQRGKWDPPVFSQKSREMAEVFAAVATLSGRATFMRHEESNGRERWTVTARKTSSVRLNNVSGTRAMGKTGQPREPLHWYRGEVWCPSTRNGTFLARRSGITYVTGNSWRKNTRLSLTMKGFFTTGELNILDRYRRKSFS